MSNFPHNTFRAADALEYVDAYRAAVRETEAQIHERMRKLSSRMDSLDDTPSYLLAAYRGYEHALVFVTQHEVIPIVKLNDLDCTPV